MSRSQRISKSPEISQSALDRVKRLSEGIRIFINNQQRRSLVEAELEIRLGTNSMGKFQSGIDKTSWQGLLDSLESQQAKTGLFNNISEWSEIHDFFYTVTIPNNKKVQVRTSRTVDNGTVVKTHTVKNKISECTVVLSGTCHVSNAARVSFATEEELNCTMPSIVTTQSVRIKQRKSFTYNNWRIDLSKCWCDTTYSSVVRKRDNHDSDSMATYEVEIECVDVGNYFNLKGHSDEYISTSCLMKIIGILPPGVVVE